MTEFGEAIREHLNSASHLSRRHIHPRLLQMFELAGLDAVFTRAEGPHLWDSEGVRYLDLLAGGGVYFTGRNHPDIHGALIDVLGMDLPNLSIVNASPLGGLLAERLLGLAEGRFAKVVFANSGSESNEVALRFARQCTGRRRFLYLDGAFHGRSYGAISVCGFPEMRERAEPMLPTCTPIRINDLAALRRELRYGDVAALIVEPVQGMTGIALERGFLREAENLCNQHGSLLIMDEVQTGLGRTGSWFSSLDQGVRPHMMTLSKTLSGGAVPVAAVLVADDVYERVYGKFGSGLVYFSTFAENNLAMVAGLATLDVLEALDAPAESARKGKLLRDALVDVASRCDVIERIEGRGLMQTVYFRNSDTPVLAAQQALMGAADSSAFAASVHVEMFREQKVITQIPGPGVNGLKVLPPVVTEDSELLSFASALESTLSRFTDVRSGPVASLGKGVARSAAKGVREVLAAAPFDLPDAARFLEKKTF